MLAELKRDHCQKLHTTHIVEFVTAGNPRELPPASTHVMWVGHATKCCDIERCPSSGTSTDHTTHLAATCRIAQHAAWSKHRSLQDRSHQCSRAASPVLPWHQGYVSAHPPNGRSRFPDLRTPGHPESPNPRFSANSDSFSRNSRLQESWKVHFTDVVDDDDVPDLTAKSMKNEKGHAVSADRVKMGSPKLEGGQSISIILYSHQPRD